MSNIGTIVDALGELRALLTEMQNKERSLKEQLVAAGVGAYEGDLFRATVSESERQTLDMEAVREKLTPQFIRAHTKVTPVTAVRVVARNGHA